MKPNLLNQSAPPGRRDLGGRRAYYVPAQGARIIPRVYVYFDKGLRPEPLIESNWVVVVLGFRQTLTNAIALPTHVQIDTSPGSPRPGGPFVTYTAVIQELRDADDLYVEPFLRFPIILT